MASILYYGTDERIPKMLDQIFQDRLKETGEANSVLRVKDEKQLDEALVAMAFDTIFCEQTTLPGPAGDWLASARKTKPGMKAPCVLVGAEAEQTKIFKLIETGWIDYILLPPDRALLIEKVWMFTSGKRNSEVRQVYSMQMSQAADIAKPGIMEELSEFDCKVRTSTPMQVDELSMIYTKAIAAEGSAAAGSVLVRCYSTEKHPGFEGQFKNSCYFVGVNSETLTAIRNSLRKQFVSGKSKG